ncbi:MAG: Sec-independent protein translocase protein TatB [Hyphomicrobiales bacterium]
MFDIGWSELLIIAVVAIIVVGPKDLPRMLRSLGKYAGQLKRTANEFRSQFDDAIRESELDDIRKAASDISSMNPVGQIKDSVNKSLDPLKSAADDIRKDVEKAEPGPKALPASQGAGVAPEPEPTPQAKPAAPKKVAGTGAP